MTAPPRRVAIAGALLAALLLALYSATAHFEFVYDDHDVVLENSGIHSGRDLAEAFTGGLWGFDEGKSERFYRPLFTLWLALCWKLFGSDPTGYHLLSVALHGLNAALVYLLGRKLALGAPGALLASGFFALHPIQIQAVAWVSATSDLLMAGASLVALILWIDALRSGSVLGRAGASAAYAAAVLLQDRALPLVAVLGLAALLYDPAAQAGGRARLRAAARASAAPLAALAGVLALRRLALGATLPALGPAAAWRVLQDAPAVAARYLQNLVWPAQLAPGYPESVALGGAALAVLAALGGLLVALPALRGRAPIVRAFGVAAFVLLWTPAFATPLLPAYALVQDRYLYLPSALLALSIGELLEHAGRSALRERRGTLRPSGARGWTRAAALAAASAWGASLIALHGGNLAVWRDELSLYERAVAVDPSSPHFLMNFANARRKAGRPHPECRLARAAAAALQRHPARGDPALVLFNLGNCLRETDRPRAALDAYRRSFEASERRLLAAELNRAVVLIELGRLEAARGALRGLLRAAPERAKAWELLGVVAARRERWGRATAHFSRALELAPGRRSVERMREAARARGSGGEAPPPAP